MKMIIAIVEIWDIDGEICYRSNPSCEFSSSVDKALEREAELKANGNIIGAFDIEEVEV